MDKDFVYIMYPVSIDKLKKMGLPFVEADESKPIDIIEEENFMPLWYSSASFPEDDIL